MEAYFEKVIPNMRNIDFKCHFRLERGTVEILCEKIVTLNMVIRKRLPLKKQVLITLWLLATPDSYWSIGDRFGVPKSSVYCSVRRIVDALYELAPQAIRWPNGGEVNETIDGFKQLNNFPGVI